MEGAATIEEIYQKYYKDINQRDFQKIYQADPTYNPQKPDKFGKYTKWLLNLYKSNNLKIEDLYKATEYLTYFTKYINKLEIKDINKYKTLPQLYKTVEPFIEADQQGNSIATSKSDEVRRIKKDVKKVYEDENWLILIPLTKEAAIYYGKNTKWCTAATTYDNMFDYYNQYGPLYINIDKRYNEKYQFHFETNQFMDVYDDELEHPVADTIGMDRKVLLSAYPTQYMALSTSDDIYPLNNGVYIRNKKEVVRYVNGGMFDDELGDAEQVIHTFQHTKERGGLKQVGPNLFYTYAYINGKNSGTVIDTKNYAVTETNNGYLEVYRNQSGQFIVYGPLDEGKYDGIGKFTDEGNLQVYKKFRSHSLYAFADFEDDENTIPSKLDKYTMHNTGRKAVDESEIYDIIDLDRMDFVLSNIVVYTDDEGHYMDYYSETPNTKADGVPVYNLINAITEYDVEEYALQNGYADENTEYYDWETCYDEMLDTIPQYCAFIETGEIWEIENGKKSKQIS